jgi:hypothetical protein
MNLSISGSDDASAWGRCLAACLATLVAGATLVLLVVFAVDPYDSGKFGWLGIEGVGDDNPRIANASRARDPQFDSAVIGDSTAMLLDPAKLSQSTGAHFVKLTGFGLDPREQLAMLDSFIRHHPRIGVLVLVTNMPWCTRDPLPPYKSSFPSWLYGEGRLDYAAHLFSWRALEHAAQRIMIGLGRRPRNNPDGGTDYEKIWLPGQFRTMDMPGEMTSTAVSRADDAFPAIAQLADLIKRLPDSVPLVLMMPPTFHTLVPQPGSIAAGVNEACSNALKRIAAGRTHGNFIDFRVDNALTRDPANFADMIHYRAKIARRIEAAIAASIRFGAGAMIDF